MQTARVATLVVPQLRVFVRVLLLNCRLARLEPTLWELFLVALATSSASLRLTIEPLQLLLSLELVRFVGFAECNDFVEKAVTALGLVLFGLF